jgi:hypothetical protein
VGAEQTENGTEFVTRHADDLAKVRGLSRVDKRQCLLFGQFMCLVGRDTAQARTKGCPSNGTQKLNKPTRKYQFPLLSYVHDLLNANLMLPSEPFDRPLTMCVMTFEIQLSL